MNGLTLAPSPQKQCSQLMWRDEKCSATKLFSAASTAPAPSPRGTAKTTSCQNAVALEKPNSAAAVAATLNAVTFAAPKRKVSRSLKRLARIVPPEIVMVTNPA